MKKTRKIDVVEQLNVNEMLQIQGGSSDELCADEIVIVYIGGKPYILRNGELRPLD
jgi:hypothetical protein